MNWNTATIDIYVDDIINQIPTASLEEELNERKKLQTSDIKTAEREEQRRSSEIYIDINPDDYNLVNQYDIQPSDFDENDLVDYLKSCGYNVNKHNIQNKIVQDLQDAPTYKLKEFLCDLFNLTHMATKENILNEIKNTL